MKLFPNPTRGPLNIEFEGVLKELHLTDLSGKILMRWTKPQQGQRITADLNMLSTGIYFLRGVGEEEVISKRVVLAR